MTTVAINPLINVIPPGELDRRIAERDRKEFEAKAAAAGSVSDATANSLSAYIRAEWDRFKRHRDSQSGWTERLVTALRAFNGQYSPEKLQEIKKFGGSEVYARIISMKCRGASSLLRDIYLTPDRPWAVEPPSDPDVPPEISEKILNLVNTEVSFIAQSGQQIPPHAIRDRIKQLMDAARQAEKKAARARADLARDRIDEMLESGGFYKALAEFLVDLPLFPFAVIKGPVVKIVPAVKYINGTAQITQTARLFWQRVSPFDVWWTPGVSDVEDAAFIERQRLTRSDLNDLLDLPGYNTAAVRAVLTDYGKSGYSEAHESGETERAQYENRENPALNQSGMITCLEYNGNVQGDKLIEYGLTNPGGEPLDPVRDYTVQAFIIGRHVIKVQLSPSPRKRHPYFVTSFEKVPGTPVGNGLPDILSDIQEVANATLRSLVNNMSIASGPQVVIRDDMIGNNNDGDDLYPWKRWHMQADMAMAGSNSIKPVDFFQPQSNAQELLGVYTKFGEIADELSAIPRHMSGANPGGGAGRTASGLAMLMGNASKILQTVAANVDRDVIGPALTGLYDMLMLTDTSGVFQGDENVRVMGVNVAIQRETQRVRQLEFLQITANPMDSQIIGIPGRAKVLRSVAHEIGLDGEGIVPPDDQLMSSIQQVQGVNGAAAAAEAQGAQAPAPSTAGPQTNVTG
jgi:hypothetical protein